MYLPWPIQWHNAEISNNKRLKLNNSTMFILYLIVYIIQRKFANISSFWSTFSLIKTMGVFSQCLCIGLQAIAKVGQPLQVINIATDWYPIDICQFYTILLVWSFGFKLCKTYNVISWWLYSAALVGYWTINTKTQLS